MVLFTAEGLPTQGQIDSGEFVTVLPTSTSTHSFTPSLTHTLCCYHTYVPAQPPRSTLHLDNPISAAKPIRRKLIRRRSTPTVSKRPAHQSCQHSHPAHTPLRKVHNDFNKSYDHSVNVPFCCLVLHSYR